MLADDDYKTLEKRYFLISQTNAWFLLGGFIATLAVFFGVTIVTVHREFQSQLAVQITNEIKELRSRAQRDTDAIADNLDKTRNQELVLKSLTVTDGTGKDITISGHTLSLKDPTLGTLILGTIVNSRLGISQYDEKGNPLYEIFPERTLP